jgi:hypothetical protein
VAGGGVSTGGGAGVAGAIRDGLSSGWGAVSACARWRIRVVMASATVAVAEAAPLAVSAPTPAHGGLAPRDMGVQFCRFHKTIHAHFHCDHCKKSFCDLCVNTKQDGDHLSHTCRSCGNECVPLLLKKPKAKGKRGFFSSLPGAFIYRPIVDLELEDVWEILGSMNPPWGGTHRSLIQLYRDSEGGECPVVLSADEAPGCGT